jgi:hypothetical protein
MTAVLTQVHDVVRAADDDLDLDAALAACVQLSLAGPHPAPGSQPAVPPPMTLSAFGMNLHAATTADGRDRKQLERICRYLLRPPFAHDAVTALPGGRVAQVTAMFNNTVIDVQHLGQTQDRRKSAPAWLAIGGVVALAGAALFGMEAPDERQAAREVGLTPLCRRIPPRPASRRAPARAGASSDRRSGRGRRACPAPRCPRW